MLAHITTLFALSTLAQAEELEPMPAPPTYVKTGGAVTVPNSHNRSILSSSVGAGVWVNDHNTLGLRVTYVYEPTNPISDVEITHAWGPILDWQHSFNPDQAVDLFIGSSVGYIWAAPDKRSENNVILPILEGGVGIHFRKKTQSGKMLTLSPELGFVPGIVAPYTAVSLSITRPERD